MLRNMARPLTCFPLEEVGGFDGGGSAHPGRGDDLSEMRIGCLPGREYTRYAGIHVVVHLDIALFHPQLAFEHLRIRFMTDEDKYALGWE